MLSDCGTGTSQLNIAELKDRIASMPSLQPGKTTIAELARWSVKEFGGPSQFLRFLKSTADIQLLSTWIDSQIPQNENVTYWDGRPDVDLDKTYVLKPIQFGFDADSSTKPFAMATTVLELAGEMDQDGFGVESLEHIISS